MTRPSKQPWHRDLIVETVWPLLDKAIEQFKARLERVPLPATSGGGSAAPGRITQQINFSAANANGSGFVGPGDTGGALLLDAIMLYRAEGGEVIRRFTLSEPSPLTDEWTVEIVHSGLNRSSPAGFSVPITLTVTGDLNSAEISPNQVLSAGQCIFAFVPTNINLEPGGRVDGTLEIERNATVD